MFVRGKRSMISSILLLVDMISPLDLPTCDTRCTLRVKWFDDKYHFNKKRLNPRRRGFRPSMSLIIDMKCPVQMSGGGGRVGLTGLWTALTKRRFKTSWGPSNSRSVISYLRILPPNLWCFLFLEMFTSFASCQRRTVVRVCEVVYPQQRTLVQYCNMCEAMSAHRNLLCSAFYVSCSSAGGREGEGGHCFSTSILFLLTCQKRKQSFYKKSKKQVTSRRKTHRFCIKD